MALNSYYEDELSYLREQGAEFARANPALAGFLAREAHDPDVERLLEGFAFLVARLRQRIDEDMPDVVQGLMRLLWPQYLRPVAPMTVLAFAPSPSGETTTVVPRGTMVRSRPIEDVSCPFVTSYAVEVIPFTIQRTELENRTASARLVLRLQAVGRSTTAALTSNRLRLFFNAEREPAVARSLLLWMLRHVRRISLATDTGSSLELGPQAVRPVGFATDEAVLPNPPNLFLGFRLLQEYLAFPAKYLFVDIEGVAALADASATSVTITVDFSRQFPEQIRVVDGHVRLNCTPAVNLFPHEAHPIRVTGGKIEYRVLPSGGHGHSIHSIAKVSGYHQGRAGRQDYAAFESFRHDMPGDPSERLHFREHIRPSVVGRGIDHYVSFVDRRNTAFAPDAEVISMGLQVSNGPVADRLGVGTIDQATADVPNSVVVTNISAVTSEVPPPIEDGLLWRLLSTLARNYGPMTDIGALRSIIASYDFRAVHDVQARRRLELLLESLAELRSAPGDAIIHGVPARMRRVTLGVTESKVGGEGELFLLGAVLDAFFASYATVNHLHALTVRGIESNVAYSWPPRVGVATPL